MHRISSPKPYSVGGKYDLKIKISITSFNFGCDLGLWLWIVILNFKSSDVILAIYQL